MLNALLACLAALHVQLSLVTTVHTWECMLFKQCLQATRQLCVWFLCGAGRGGSGRLGDGGTAQQNTPVAVSGSHNFTLLTAGNEHTCGLLGNGSALCWGENDMLALLLNLAMSPCGLPCSTACAQTPGMGHPQARASSRAMQCMCGCFCVLQVTVSMERWAMGASTELTKLLQWQCLAHTASHCSQRAMDTHVACLATGLHSAGVRTAGLVVMPTGLPLCTHCLPCSTACTWMPGMGQPPGACNQRGNRCVAAVRCR